MDQFDVVVVGARCAGSPLAIMLARRGLRVCVIDRATFPSDTPSTHVLQPTGVLILRGLGVLNALWAAGAAPLHRFTLIVDDTRMEAVVDPAEFGVPGMCVRRVTLDDVLVRAAVAAGVEVRTGTNLTGLIRDGDRVVGVETSAGPITAALVVGADGQHSRVAALVGAPEYAIAPPGRLFAWGYFAGVPRDDQIRLARRGELAFLAGSTDGDLFMAGVAPALARKSEFLADRESSFAADVQCWPELADLLAGAERDGPLRIVSSWHGYFRPAAGPGWALLGDAGQFKDPTPGQGISDALRHAQRLTEVIAATHAEPAALDDGLRRWWRWRDRDSREMHWFASDLGAPGPTPALRASMIGDLASTPAGTRSFLHLINHDIPPSRVFTPKRLARAVIAVRRARQVPVRDIAREALSLVAGDVRHARLGAPKPAGVRSSRRRAARPGSASETVAATPARR